MTRKGEDMNRPAWQQLLAVTPLFGLALLLAGCPKAPTLAPPASTGSTGGSQTTVTGRDAAGGQSAADAGAAEGAGIAEKVVTETVVTETIVVAEAGVPSPQEFVETPALRDVYFEFDRYTIRTQDASALEHDARWLKANPTATALLEGHADERGTNEYNIALGDRRTRAARDYLTSLGVPASRIVSVSYGEERPFCIERTEACWAKNRRVHFLVKR
jgi:peptidoglycan-associated lipoprotein